MFRYGPTRTGHNPIENKVGVGNVATLQENWSGGVTGAPTSPTVANGVAYVGSGFDLLAFDARGVKNCMGSPASCSPLWSAALSDLAGSATIANGVVYISGGSTLYAFDAAGVTGCSGTPKTCAPLWSASGPKGSNADASPVVVDGVVYVGFFNELLAFDAAGVTGCSGAPKTCVPLWIGIGNTHCLDFAVEISPPAVAQGIVYVACGGNDELFGAGRLFAFDADATTGCSTPPHPGTPKTCEPLWSADVGQVFEPPVVSNGAVYVNDATLQFGDGVGRLRVFDAAGVTGCSGTPKTCTPLWTADIGASLHTSAVAAGVVYVVSGGTLFAFDAAGTTGCSGSPKTCAPLWTTTPGGIATTSPAVANGVVYVGFNTFGPASTIHAFDATGTVGCSGTPKTCMPVWTASPGSPGARSPVIANGIVYGADENQLRAFALP
jgi:hypothetical protein